MQKDHLARKILTSGKEFSKIVRELGKNRTGSCTIKVNGSFPMDLMESRMKPIVTKKNEELNTCKQPSCPPSKLQTFKKDDDHHITSQRGNHLACSPHTFHAGGAESITSMASYALMDSPAPLCDSMTRAAWEFCQKMPVH